MRRKAGAATALVVSLIAAGGTPALADEPPVVRKTIVCEEGNFKGEADVTVANNRVTVTSYRITRLNGQEGGNKANLSLLASYSVGDTTDYELHVFYGDSGDELRQDGETHDVHIAATAPDGYGMATYVSLEFEFDKSGHDVVCEEGWNP